MKTERLKETVIGCAYTVYNYFHSGYLENVYKNAMLLELKKQSDIIAENLDVETEVPIDVYYHDIIVGKYKADIIINNQLILELKAIENITRVHSLQLVNYLTATGIDDGIIINFGNKDKMQFITRTRLYKPTKNLVDFRL